MADGQSKNVNFMPKTLPKQTSHIVRPVKYLGNISAFLGLLGLFAAFLGVLGVISGIFRLGINVPGTIPVSIVGALLGLLGLFFAIRQGKVARTIASDAGALLSVFALIFSTTSVAFVLTTPSASQDNDIFPSPDPIGGGYCASEPDCSDFGSNHCNNEAVCASDSLCHCQFVTCRGSSCSPLSCSSGCDANSYCDSGSNTCVFNTGGKTDD